jgi:single-strand DNA-binding protein
MPNYDLHVIAGHVGNSPELRYTKEGTAVTSVNVAVNNPFKPDAPATWYKCTCWRKTAEFVNEYVQKGTAILVQGKGLAIEEWMGKDGITRHELAMNADSVQLLGRAGERDNTAPDEQQDMPF